MADEPGERDAVDTPPDDLLAPTDDAAHRRSARRRWYRRPLPWVAIGVVLVLVVGGGAFFVIRSQARADAAPATYTVTSTTLQQTVSATGTIQPADQADLSFASQGTVSTVDVQVGDKVTAGEKLAAIDPASLQSDLVLAQAQVTQAQTQVAAASGGSATETASASAQLASAQAKLQAAQQALTAATLVSPITGVVASVDVAVGDQVGGSSSGGSSTARTSTATTGTGDTTSTAAISVISTSSWIVDASVGSADLPDIKAGLQVQITPSGAQQAIFGTVKSAGIVASSSSDGAASFPVVIAVTGTPTGLYAGTSAAVNIIVKQIADALVVPTQAVHTTGGKTEVTVVAGGKDVETAVTVGDISGTRSQITKGLSAGDVILVPSFAGTNSSGGTTRTGGAGFGGTGGFGGGTGGFGGTGGGFGNRNGGQGGNG